MKLDHQQMNDYIYQLMEQKKVKKKIKQLNKLSDEEIDSRFEKGHTEAFQKINCLDCANCCKTKGPSFTKRDINRIAAHLKITPPEFSDKYLTINNDGNYALDATPCLFLKEDNYCSIYEIRPKACASYPHTDTRNIRNLFPYLEEHTSTCPAIEDIFLNIKI